ncbi:MAG: transcriptional repressor LexA [Candidatus Omnitrophica bacterium]|nr:transcriptional repressor LexA [Candidatus Omnitrophota bacterium]
MENVTDIQKEIWLFIKQSVEEQGYPPTLRELGDAFDIASTNGVRYHLRILEKKGYLQHRKGSRRGIQLLNPDGSSPYKQSYDDIESLPTGEGSDNVINLPDNSLPPGLTPWWKPLPIVGRVAAGSPILAEENKEDEIGVDQALFGGGPGVELFGLRINGDSMTGAGIHDGDLAVIRKQRTARDGEIVVATVNDEATVKRYQPEDSRIVLKAENPDYPSIIVTPEDRFRIAGVVTGLIRRRVF